MINAPVLHVNGDYPDGALILFLMLNSFVLIYHDDFPSDVARAMEVAFKYRNSFRKAGLPSIEGVTSH